MTNWLKKRISKTLSYLSNRSQFVHFDANSLKTKQSRFGVPQGSILGPVLFNLYVNDLQDCFSSNAIQYADDTTIYEHCRPNNIIQTEYQINRSLKKLESWAENNSLTTNALKTKYMIFSSKRFFDTHNLQNHIPTVIMGSDKLQLQKDCTLLG